MYIVEPLNRGHTEPSHSVLYREVVYLSEVQNVLTIWENEHLGPCSASFIERLFLLCPPLRGSFIGGSTVIIINYHYYYYLLYSIKLTYQVLEDSPLESINHNATDSIDSNDEEGIGITHTEPSPFSQRKENVLFGSDKVRKEIQTHLILYM